MINKFKLFKQHESGMYADGINFNVCSYLRIKNLLRHSPVKTEELLRKR
jgi:hypothetical protein